MQRCKDVLIIGNDNAQERFKFSIGVVEQDRGQDQVCCVKRLTLPWKGYESTVALNVQRSWGRAIERDRAKVNAWHMNACALQASASVSNE
ncbi:hypothetical protein EVAR_12011_1 [Eumeta japonica]|uniref:Uncharacterized protein n=1 Tax=Eumeta variegata TaxID=151549 RepID=A0A4C1U578_EUMVA|nr:hypothetical protein EVAR_12011_1 [Eumeta japonica]